MMSFDQYIGQWYPHVPLDISEAIVAPLWAELEGYHKAGIVLFREVTDAITLHTMTNDIKSYFAQYQDFVATWAFVATWYNVPHCCSCHTEDPSASVLIFTYHLVFYVLLYTL